MSQEKKETSEPRMSLAALAQPGFRLERQWSPGVIPASLEEFNLFTDQLSRRLLDTSTPEQIAIVAAQHIIAMDQLRSLKESQESMRPDLIKTLTDQAIKAVHDVVQGVANAVKKREATKRMAGGLDELNKHASFIGSELKRHAKELWEADTDQEYRVAEMARLVRDAVERDYPGKTPSTERIKTLIRPIAPEYASKGGAPKGKRKR